MAVALNVFKTVTANVTTSSTSIYTAPTGYTTVVLMAQVSNIGNTTVTVSAVHLRGSNETAILKNGIVPTSDAINLLTGKLVLNTSDSFKIVASENGKTQVILSILETANP
jgi:hypothetical protein